MPKPKTATPKIFDKSFKSKIIRRIYNDSDDKLPCG